SHLNIRVHAGSPTLAAIAVFDLNISNRRRLRPRAQSVLVIMRNFKSRDAGGAEAMDQRRERSVSFSCELHRSPVARKPCSTPHGPVMTLRLKSPKLPGRRALDVFTPEHRLQ